jgi:hypothetical protein
LKAVYDLKIINLFGMLYGFYGKVNTKTGINDGHQYEPGREICLWVFLPKKMNVTRRIRHSPPANRSTGHLSGIMLSLGPSE